MKISSWLRLSLILLLTISCVNEEVKLPVNSIKGVQEPIYDNTQIWMFYEEIDGKANLKLNKNNKISSTHWVFNIDKRLPMGLVAPALEEMIKSRKATEDKAKKKDLHNYFSYVDTLSKKMTTLQFDKIEYRTVTEFPRQVTPQDSTDQSLVLSIKPTALEINGRLSTIAELSAFLTPKTKGMLVIDLYFDACVTYDRYLYVKALLAPYASAQPDGSSTEFILNH